LEWANSRNGFRYLDKPLKTIEWMPAGPCFNSNLTASQAGTFAACAGLRPDTANPNYSRITVNNDDKWLKTSCMCLAPFGKVESNQYCV
jgi:hypothetical protein